MKASVRFKCKNCDEWHVGVPGWGYPFPMPYWDVPELERSERCFLTSDLCVVDDQRFFVRGCLDLPIAGYADVLVIGAWVEIGDESFFEYQDLIDLPTRSKYGPYEGTLSAALPTYDGTEGLRVAVVVNDSGTRPSIVIEDSEHQLGADQKNGLSIERIQSIYSYFERRRAEG